MADFRGWALVVIDMQNDFLAKGGYYDRRQRYEAEVRRGRLNRDLMMRRLRRPGAAPSGGFRPRTRSIASMIRNVRRVIARCRQERMPIAYVKALYDHHSEVRPRFLLENPDRRDYPCKPGTWGAEFVDPIKAVALEPYHGTYEKIIEKHTFNGFYKTGLGEFLGQRRVHTLLVAGVETHVCVLATAQSASFHQFKTIILTDCTAAPQTYREKYALNIFRDGFGTTRRSDELFERRFSIQDP